MRITARIALTLALALELGEPEQLVGRLTARDAVTLPLQKALTGSFRLQVPATMSAAGHWLVQSARYAHSCSRQNAPSLASDSGCSCTLRLCQQCVIGSAVPGTRSDAMALGQRSGPPLLLLHRPDASPKSFRTTDSGL